MPRQGSAGSTGASVPKGSSVPARSRSRQREGVARSGAPGRHDGRRVAEQVAGLHGGGDAKSREAGQVRRMHELGVLHAVPCAGHRGQPASTSSTVRTAPSPMAWIWLAMPASAARRARAASCATVSQRHARRAARWRAGRVVRLVGLQQGGRAAAQGAIGEELQPAVAVAAGGPAPPRRRPVRKPELDGALELLLADAGHDPQRQPAGRRQGAVERRAAAQLRIGRHAARVVHRRHAEARQVARRRP